MKRLSALFVALLLAFPALAQLPPSGGLVVDNTPIQGGTTDFCLYKKSNGRLGSQACSTGSVSTFSAGTTGFTPSTATSGAVTLAGVLIGANGGTGVANTGKTVTLGGNLTTSGAFASTFTMTNTTTVTFPTTGTLATLAGSEALTGKTYNGLTITTTTGTLTMGSATLTAGVSGTVAILGTNTSAADISINGNVNTNGAFFTASGGSKINLTTNGEIQIFNNLNTHLTAVRLGAANVSPTGTTIFGEPSRSGTDNNTAGGNLTITSGIGTGNATGSSLILAAPLAVASGTGAQTQTTGITITAALVTHALPSTFGSATITMTALANAATTSAVCYNTGTGLLTYNSTVGTCTVSTKFAKDNITAYTPEEGYKLVMAMKPVRYTLKKGLPTYVAGEQIGLIAEDAYKIDPRMVAMNKDGSAAGFRYEQYTAALTAAVQYLQSEVDVLKASR